MYTIKDKFNELFTYYKKTKNENSLLYIYRNIRSYIQENGTVSFFEDVVPFIENLNFSEYTVASNMMNEIEKFALEFENNKLKEEIKYVLLKCNTFEIQEKSKEEELEDVSKENSKLENINETTVQENVDESSITLKKEDDNKDEYKKSNSTCEENTNKITKDSDSYSDFGSDDSFFSESREYCNLYTQSELHGECKELIYIGLSKMLKPLLKFKAKECVNLMVHFALKTNTLVLNELLELYKQKKDWQIEILLFIAFINKKLEKEYNNEMNRCKVHLKDFIELNRINDCNFIICKLFFFLDIHYDEEMYNYLENYCLSENSKYKFYCAKNFNRFVKFDFLKEDKKEYIFYNLFFYSKENQMVLFRDKKIFENFDLITIKSYKLYLQRFKEKIEACFCNLQNHLEDFYILSNLFVVYFRKFQTKEMLYFFVLITNIQDIFVKSRIKKIIGNNINEICCLIFERINKNIKFEYSNNNEIYCKCYYSIKADYKTFNVAVRGCDCYKKKDNSIKENDETGVITEDNSNEEIKHIDETVNVKENTNINDATENENDEIENTSIKDNVNEVDIIENTSKPNNVADNTNNITVDATNTAANNDNTDKSEIDYNDATNVNNDNMQEHINNNIVDDVQKSNDEVVSHAYNNDGNNIDIVCNVDTTINNDTDDQEHKENEERKDMIVKHSNLDESNDINELNIDFNKLQSKETQKVNFVETKNEILDKLDKLSLESFDWDVFFCKHIDIDTYSEIQHTIEKFVASMLDEEETILILVREINVLTFLSNWCYILQQLFSKIKIWRCKKMFIENICKNKDFFGEEGKAIIKLYTNDSVFYIRSMAKDYLTKVYAEQEDIENNINIEKDEKYSEKI
ncbi:hypothetical protein BDAP_002240 [Binucleata daphniae]